jgi:hypothetical protein
VPRHQPRQQPALDDLIAAFRRRPRADEAAREQADPALARQREAWAVEAQEARQAGRPAAHRDIRVERYVRVGCPARGTSLLTDNLDIFLSGLFALVRKFGSLGAHVAGSATGIPAPGPRPPPPPRKPALPQPDAHRSRRQAPPGPRPAGHRGDAARLAPGQPARPRRHPEGSGWASSPATSKAAASSSASARCSPTRVLRPGRQRPGGGHRSMYGGIAWQAGARALFVQGENVNHFRYFRDDTPPLRPAPAPRHAGWLRRRASPAARLGEPAIAEPEPVPDAPRRAPARRRCSSPARHHGQPPRADGDPSGSSPAPRPRRPQAHRHEQHRPGVGRRAGGLAYGNLGRYLALHQVEEFPTTGASPRHLGEQFAAGSTGPGRQPGHAGAHPRPQHGRAGGARRPRRNPACGTSSSPATATGW